MAISLGFTTLSNCETSGDFTTDGAAGLANSDYPPKRGTQCVEFHCAGASTTPRGLQLATAVTGFDLASTEVQIWFLNPSVDQNGAQLLRNEDNAVRLRVYSGTNWADYYQEHLKVGGSYPGGWMLLRASGAAGTEDANSGVWGTAQSQSITNVALLVTTLAGNDNKNAAEYGIDWVKRVTKIDIDGYNGGVVPWTLDDIVAADLSNGGTVTGDDGEWGCFTKTENFYSSKVALEFGDGVAAGAFTAENEYINLDCGSPDFKLDVDVLNNFTVTMGKKDADGASGIPYAVNGVQCVAGVPLFGTGRNDPSFVTASGAILNMYATLLRGFGSINFGSNGTSSIEIIKSDIYINGLTEMRTTGMSISASRIHRDVVAGELATIYSDPTFVDDVQLFKATTALSIRVANVKLERLQVNDATAYDLAVLEGVTVEFVNSSFDAASLARLT